MEVRKKNAYGVISANEIAKIPVEKWDAEDWEQVCRGAGLESDFDKCNTKEDMVTLTKKAVVTLMQDVKNVYEPNLAEQGKKKRKTHTSAAVKARWRKNHRDVIHIELPKGGKTVIRAFAADQLDEDGNGQSMTGFIMQCVYNCYPELESEIQALRADSSNGGALLL